MNRDSDAPGPGSPGIASSFPAATEQVEQFIAAVHGFLAEQRLGRLAFDVELLAREALVNAVQHGSSGDAGRLIRASLRLADDELVLAVRDEGPGWDWRAWRKTSPEPAAESGRGLFIIGKYADGYSFNESGNVITIIKRVPPEEQNMTTPQDSTVRIQLEPRLAAQDVPALRDALRAAIQQGVSRVELDFASVESLDSMGIGLLAATHNSLAKLGGSLALFNVSKDIHKLLTLMRLDKHMCITPIGGAQP